MQYRSKNTKMKICLDQHFCWDVRYLHDHGWVFHNSATWSELLNWWRGIQGPGAPEIKEKGWGHCHHSKHVNAYTVSQLTKYASHPPHFLFSLIRFVSQMFCATTAFLGQTETSGRDYNVGYRTVCNSRTQKPYLAIRNILAIIQYGILYGSTESV